MQTETEINIAGTSYQFHSLQKLEVSMGKSLSKLPFSIRVLLENLLRHEDGKTVTAKDIEALANWTPKVEEREIQFMPARVLLQDFTGVPAVVDLAAMRSALVSWGEDPGKINPLQPVDLVIDHSVQVDVSGSPEALQKNAKFEFERNQERYEFLKWAQSSFSHFRVVPPATGICHQVNLEYLAQVASTREKNGQTWIFPDTVIGTDSHTPMVNGLGVVGWGVGGIEAEAAMLGQPCSMLIPEVIGFRLTGQLQPGVTATDLVLTIVQMLRKKGVVGKFVEYFGPGCRSLKVENRATIANMAPEYGATVGIFPVDSKTIEFLKMTNRESAAVLTEKYYTEQGMFFTDNTPDPVYSDTMELDLSTVEASISGPSRPQDRIPLSMAPESSRGTLETFAALKKTALKDLLGVKQKVRGQDYTLSHGDIVIAAITSCTNTSNPAVMLAAGLLAKKAVEKGLKVKPWVKTSMAPGSMVVDEYYRSTGLMPYLEQLGYHIVGYGCTTCIGNSGPLKDEVNESITTGDLNVAAVLSGNRNFEARIHPQVRANYLASPPLVIAYALAGTMNVNLTTDPLGQDQSGKDVYLKDLMPSEDEVLNLVAKAVTKTQFEKSYGNLFLGSKEWQAIKQSTEQIYDWNSQSTYLQNPPFFKDIPKYPEVRKDVVGARVLAFFGDSVTTDHISPAGDIQEKSAAGQYLKSQGVDKANFNSYGARRGNFQVMARGTFANVRIKNKMLKDKEGPLAIHIPTGDVLSVFDVSERYQSEKTPLMILAGKEYGSGSSRDWAAKGPRLQGVEVVIAESYERIHRSNLVGMGILPLQFLEGENAQSLGLTGYETFTVQGLGAVQVKQKVKVEYFHENKKKDFEALVRIDTPNELEYYKHGGILLYVLRQLAGIIK